jgi:hypothetical protein
MIWMILYILFWHWVADFVAQTREMAEKKSTSIKWLTKHILAYGNHMLFGSLPILALGAFFGKNWALIIIIYVTVNMALHWITDYFTSKWTSRAWVEKKIKKFFTIIGLDQFIHVACLLLTYKWLIS